METRGNPERELQFRPLSEGLGFHPFSNGLPYSPVAPSGAVSAGPPRAALQIQMPAISRPVAPAPAPSTPAFASPAAVPVAAPASEIRGSSFGFIYLFRRTMAFAVDLCFNTSLCALAFLAVLWPQKPKAEVFWNPGVLLLGVLFFLVFNWAVITAQEIVFKTSFGKRLIGLRLHGSGWAVLLRAVFFIPSVLFFGTGLLWALIDRDKRCWHDVAADLQPEEATEL